MGAVTVVTGAAGFIGSHLVDALLERGDTVRAFIRYASSGSQGLLEHIEPRRRDRLEMVAGDVRDPRLVERAMDGASTVFHLAALIGIPYSYEGPESYVDVNVRGALNVLEAARRIGTEKVVLVSTSEVYGSAQRTPMDESHPLSAQSPYAATKIASDQLGLSYHRSFGVPVAIARPFNTYGPRQSTRAIIPTILAQARQGGSVELGNVAPVRDFVYVDDTVSGLLAIGSSPASVGRVLHLATGRGVSIHDLVGLIGQALSIEISIRASADRQRPAASEVDRLIGSAELARELVGWSPRVRLEEGLVRAARWFEGQRLSTEYRV